MASSKIKKKTGATKPSVMPRQGAVPCLVLVVIVLIIVGFIIFAAVSHIGG